MGRYYNQDYISHAWGKDQESKKKEKSYNSWYYQKHKNEILAKRKQNRKLKRQLGFTDSVANGLLKLALGVQKFTKVVGTAVQTAARNVVKASRKVAKDISDWAKNKKTTSEEKQEQRDKHPSSTIDPPKEQSKKEEKPKQEKKYKYLLKVTENGYTRYFYTQHEVDAYNRRKQKEAEILKDLKKKDESESNYDRLKYLPDTDANFGGEKAQKALEDAMRQLIDDRISSTDSYKNLSEEELKIVKEQMYDAMVVNPYVDIGFDTNGDGYINPDSADEAVYNYNCAYCTATYDLRQRGYDVQADNWDYDYQGTPKEIESWYEGGKFTIAQTSGVFDSGSKSGKKILKEISNAYEPGARGQLCVYWIGGGGHSMSFQVLPNGETVIFDAQTKAIYDSGSIGSLFDYVDTSTSGNVLYMRTDDLPPSEELLATVAGQNVSETQKPYYGKRSK